MKLAIARSMMWTPELLLLDEPTNHLDHMAVEWLVKYIQGLRGKITTCVVSHDYDFNAQVLTDVCHMCDQKIEYHGGAPPTPPLAPPPPPSPTRLHPARHLQGGKTIN